MGSVLPSRLLRSTSLLLLSERPHQCDRSQPPGDPSVVSGGIDRYSIEMAKNEKSSAAQAAPSKTHAGNAARASKMH